MAEALPTTGVVEWPIDLGSDVTAPVRWTMAGSPDDGPGLVVWFGGHGVGMDDLAVAAPILKESSGAGAVVGVVVPIKEIVCKASNVPNALDRFLQEGVHRVAAQIDPVQTPFFGG